MKRTLFHFALMILVLTGSARASVGLLPEEKQPIVVAVAERNPYGKKGPKTPLKIDEDTESEEARIRNILNTLSVTGMGEREGQTTALLGPFVLKPGAKLPPVLPDQKEVVLVILVQSNLVELGFVDKDGTADARKITLNIKRKPTVRYDLGIRATPPATEGTGGALGGTIKVDEDSKKQP